MKYFIETKLASYMSKNRSEQYLFEEVAQVFIDYFI